MNKILIGILAVGMIVIGADAAEVVDYSVGTATFTLSEDGTDMTLTTDKATITTLSPTTVSATTVTASGTVQGEQVTSTDDALVTDDLTVSGKVNFAESMTLAYANKTGNYTNTATDYVVSYNTSAVTTNTLPEASTVLGQVFIIALQDDDGDLVVETDGTDKFDGTNNKATFADAGDSFHVMATAADVYTILVNVGGTLGTQ